MSVTLPNEWEPRDYQLPLWLYMQGGGKRAVAVWHRRCGKDSLGLNYAACASQNRVGVYWHMLPTARQGRKVIWDGIDFQGRRMIDQAFPPEMRRNVNSQEMKIELHNGSIWQVVGSDNFDNLMGSNPVGIIFSEYSLTHPKAWDYMRPILAENGGWAIFIYTARGPNHGFKLLTRAQQNPEWFKEILTVDDTKRPDGSPVITEDAINEDRLSGMSEEMIQQEYYCSFEAALIGAYFGKEMEAMRKEDRICSVPWQPELPVHTGWDLGVRDTCVIWFVQVAGKEIHWIDCYDNSGVGLDHYVRVLQERPYVYGDHIFPHDAAAHEIGSGRTREEMLWDLGLKPRVLPRQKREDGINAVRLLLPRSYMDAKNCERGIDGLTLYRREFDEARDVFHQNPVHDWTSHYADAARSIGMGLHTHRKRPTANNPVQQTEHDIFGW